MSDVKKSRTTKEEIDYGYDSQFPTRLRKLLEKTTQGELAEACNVARQSVAQWKDGKTKPDIYYLGKIADFFNVSTDYLLGRSDVQSAEIDNIAINKKIGLDEKSIEMLTNIKCSKYHDFTIFVLNYSIIYPEILRLLTNYLFSFIYNEINEKPFSHIPLKIPTNFYYSKIMFSDLIEKLPKTKDAFEEKVKQDSDLLQKFIYQFLCKNVDEKECNRILMQELGYDFNQFIDYNDENKDEEDYFINETDCPDEPDFEAEEKFKEEQLETAFIIEKILEMKQGETDGNGN